MRCCAISWPETSATIWAAQIAKSIRRTYQKYPKDFWYYHNGLTIICDKFAEENSVATLTNPSVINGAQTLYAISSSKSTLARPGYSPNDCLRNGYAAGGRRLAATCDSWRQHAESRAAI